MIFPFNWLFLTLFEAFQCLTPWKTSRPRIPSQRFFFFSDRDQDGARRESATVPLTRGITECEASIGAGRTQRFLNKADP